MNVFIYESIHIIVTGPRLVKQHACAIWQPLHAEQFFDTD